jgi:hypothetical protein
VHTGKSGCAIRICEAAPTNFQHPQNLFSLAHILQTAVFLIHFSPSLGQRNFFRMLFCFALLSQ